MTAPLTRPGPAIEVVGAETGPTVVLVHGAPDRAASFRSVLPHLTSLRVVLYDRRGYGRSTELEPAAGMIDHAEDLWEILERSEPPGVVVAHSFGSNPAMLAASLRPQAFAALGVWEPPLGWIEPWSQRNKDYNAAVAASDDPTATIESMYRRLLGDETWNALSPEARQQRRAEGVAFQTDMASQIAAPYDFDDVTVPTIVGYGTATARVHSLGAAWLVDHLPDARLDAIADAGHFAHHTHPEQFARFVHTVAAIAAPPTRA